MNKKIYTALGLMSGTSLDGVDAAILKTDGERIFGYDIVQADPRVVPSKSTHFRKYSERDRQELMFTTKVALEWMFNGPKPNILARAENIVNGNHSIATDEIFWRYNPQIDNYEPAIDLIGYHGQTVLHHPPRDGQKGQTLQLGNGQVLADEFAVPCVYDFRTNDVEGGGQGAPLAPIYHKALVEYSSLNGITAVLNLGGVGNVTLVGPYLLKATDTGPANGPLDSWVQLKGHAYDPNGELSENGCVDFERVDRWLKADFFSRPTPRSADRYDFDVISDMQDMSLQDGAATLCYYCVSSVKQSLALMSVKPDRIIVCGGGRHNRTIMTMLDMELNCPILTAEHVGWNSDMIEAQAFAFLAVRSVLNLPISFPDTTGVPDPMTGGRIAYPASSKRG